MGLFFATEHTRFSVDVKVNTDDIVKGTCFLSLAVKFMSALQKSLLRNSCDKI